MNDNLFKSSTFCALTEEYALEISQWEYETPYDVYNFKGRPNGYLLDKSTWGTRMTPADLEELAKKKAKEEAEKNPEKEGTSP